MVAGVLVVATAVTQAQAPPRGPDDLKAPKGDPGLDVLACYEIINEQADEQPLKARMVTDNFGGDVVNILGHSSPFFCESALKVNLDADPIQSLGQPGRWLWQCFDVERGANPDDDLSLVTANFGTEPVTVGTAVQMCESAHKRHVTAAGGVIEVGREGAMALHCFSLTTPLGEEPPERGPNGVELTTVNFGLQLVNIGQTTLLCEEASKHTADPRKRDIGKPTGRVWQCFSIGNGGPPDPEPASVTLTTTNFGTMEVEVGDLFMMCERARKVYSLSATPVDPRP
jgi:hypothetical protein